MSPLNRPFGFSHETFAQVVGFLLTYHAYCAIAQHSQVMPTMPPTSRDLPSRKMTQMNQRYSVTLYKYPLSTTAETKRTKQNLLKVSPQL